MPKPRGAVSGHAVHACNVTQRARGRQILQPISLLIEPGELVAIAGGSGSGKTTLLRILAGLQTRSSGTVTHDGVPVGIGSGDETSVGYVPQDDIIHGELPLERTLEHAARLRLPRASAREINELVGATLKRLWLADSARIPVRNLSGGQRKRASIAVELLRAPRLFVLDEPTSGLDPATSAELMDILRGLAQAGTTVVLTTHSPEDLTSCSRVIFLGHGGRLVFDGTPQEALDHFDVERLSQVYAVIAHGGSLRPLPADFNACNPLSQPDSSQQGLRNPRAAHSRSKGIVVLQLRTLVAREFELLLRNPLTLAIILGSPVLVTAMMTVLFDRGTVDPSHPLQSVNLAFWLAFDGFFFGLTYGLLQISMEFRIFAREHQSGVSITAYVASKVCILMPILLAIDVIMLAVLRSAGRLPADGPDVYGPLCAVFLLDALAGLAFGLFASALVRHPAQAALALPMICFPQVLFAGAIVPVSAMAAPGRWLSFGMATRWSFEAFTRILNVGDRSDAAVGTMPDYSAAVNGSQLPGAVALLVMGLVFAFATIMVLRRRANSA